MSLPLVLSEFDRSRTADNVTTIQIAAHLLARAGLNPASHLPAGPVTELAVTRSSRDWKPLELARMAAKSAGWLDSELVNPYECVRAAMSAQQFGDALLTTIGAVLLGAWESERDTTIPWAVRGEVKNFKDSPRTGFGAGGSLPLVPRGGSAEHLPASGSLDVTQRVRRYGMKLFIDEMDIIDDNVGVILQRAEELGRAARRTVPDLAYGVLASNPTLSDGVALFHATHGNVASDVMSVDTVSTARSAIAKQAVDDVPLHLVGNVLIVPTDLENSARAIARGLVTGNEVPIKVVVEPRLQNGFTDPASGIAYAGSSTRWYLAAAQQRTVEISFLDGIETPDLSDQEINEPGRTGRGYVVKIDAGACALDYRGLYQGNT